jgi:hypothetical protein
MNEQQLPTGSHMQENSGVELPAPHFDDIAIAIAQPVEPLSNTKHAPWQRFAVLRRHVSTTVLLVILCVAVGFGTVAFGLAGLHQHLSNVEPQSAVSTEQPQSAETAETSKSEKEKDLSPRPAARKIQPRANADAKPVARKVGEITY